MLRKILVASTSMLLALTAAERVWAAHYFRHPLTGVTTTSGPATDPAAPGGGNRAPAFGAVAWPTTGTVGAALSWSRPGMATDPDGDAVSYHFTGLPAGLTGSTAGAISGTPQAPGSYAVAVQASDPAGATTTTGFTMVIAPANQAPVWNLAQWGIGLPESTANQYYWWGYANAAVDPEGDAITYGATGLPCCLMMSSSSGAIYGYPMNAGSYPITLTATDSKGAAASQSGTLVVNPETGTAPYFVWADWPGAATVGAPIVATPANPAEDWEGDPITYHATDLPPGLSINPTTGVLSGTPTKAGYYVATIIASDPSTKYGSTSFSIMVTPGPNFEPAFAGIAWPTQAIIYQPLSETPAHPASDPDGDDLYYVAFNLPSNLSIDPSTGVISGTPTEYGTYNIRIEAYDGHDHTATADFTLEVIPEPPPENHAPVFRNVAWPTTIALYEDIVTEADPAEDIDGDPLFYRATGLPPGLSINQGDGVIDGFPYEPGTYDVTITAYEVFKDKSTSTTLTITVPTPPNRPPQWDHEDDSVILYNVNNHMERYLSYWYDPDGDVVTMTMDGDLPPGLSLSGTQISGTPTASGTYVITLTLQDSRGATTPRTITLRSNDAPVLSKPLPDMIETIAAIGQPQSFAINLGAYVTDPDGDSVSFSPYSGPGSATIDSNGSTYSIGSLTRYVSNGYSDTTGATVAASDPHGARTEIALPMLRTWIAFGAGNSSTGRACGGQSFSLPFQVFDAYATSPSDIKVQLPSNFGNNIVHGYTVEKLNRFPEDRYAYAISVNVTAVESGVLPATIIGSRGDTQSVTSSLNCGP